MRSGLDPLGVEAVMGQCVNGNGTITSSSRQSLPPTVEVWPSCTDVGRRAADLIESQLARRPCSVFALPTGTTPLAMYDEIVRRCEEGNLRLDGAKFFNLDEYVGLHPGHEGSFYRYMRERFWGPAKLKEWQYDVPRGWVQDLDGECKRYDEAIVEAGGIDLAVVGLGVNAHVGFNEPGTDPELGTHLVELSESTRRAQAEWFGGLVGRVPRRALTVGIRTLLGTRAIVLIACGRHKARIVHEVLLGPPTPERPASLLRIHPNLTVILDQDAAGLLWPKEFKAEEALKTDTV
ncbi:MAG: glucosamine-6-phosphate deaminase [Bacillota bacterium]